MPFCSNCGNQVSAEAAHCSNCGHPQPAAVQPAGYAQQPGYGPPPQQPYGYTVRRTEGSAVASLVLGIAGFVVCPIVCSILAIVLGNQAKQKIAQDPNLDGEGMAKAGVILGWIGVGVMGLIFVGAILAVASGGGTGF